RLSGGFAVASSGPLLGLQPPGNGPVPGGRPAGDSLVHIRFAEVSSDPSGNQGAPGDTRWLSQPVIGATLKTATLPDGAVVLGSFTSSGDGGVSHGDTGRQYSGVRLPGPLPPSGTPTFATLSCD